MPRKRRKHERSRRQSSASGSASTSSIECATSSSSERHVNSLACVQTAGWRVFWAGVTDLSAPPSQKGTQRVLHQVRERDRNYAKAWAGDALPTRDATPRRREHVAEKEVLKGEVQAWEFAFPGTPGANSERCGGNLARHNYGRFVPSASTLCSGLSPRHVTLCSCLCSSARSVCHPPIRSLSPPGPSPLPVRTASSLGRSPKPVSAASRRNSDFSSVLAGQFLSPEVVPVRRSECAPLLSRVRGYPALKCTAQPFSLNEMLPLRRPCCHSQRYRLSLPLSLCVQSLWRHPRLRPAGIRPRRQVPHSSCGAGMGRGVHSPPPIPRRCMRRRMEPKIRSTPVTWSSTALRRRRRCRRHQHRGPRHRRSLLLRHGWET